MVWLAGNGGMLGSAVERALAARGIPFIASDREVDIRERDRALEFIGGRPVDWIVNCAAYTAVDRAEDEEELARSINGTGPGVLAGIAREIGATMVHLSTDYVFDGAKEGPYREDDAPNPLGVYGRSKLEGEIAVAREAQKHYIIRTAWLYGVGGPNFVSTMLRLFRERDEVAVVNDQWGSPTNALDLAGAVLAVIERGEGRYGTCHFTNEGCVTWHGFALELYRLARLHGLLDREVRIRAISTEEFGARAPRPRNGHLSKDKIRTVLGIDIRPWEEALEEHVVAPGRSGT